jgi:hypothetical protein
MNDRSLSADFVTAFATGWPEQQPDILVLSLKSKTTPTQTTTPGSDWSEPGAIV